jgi:cytochrome c peroxidase
MRPFAVLLAVAVALYAAGPRLPLGLDLYRPSPEDNRITPAKVALGRLLFHDRRLSRDGSLSCATCHDPRRAFTDGRTVAQGIGGARGNRNTPTIVNRAWGRSFFFDGRAATLERQVLQPILSVSELGASPETVLSLARTHYRRRFREAFDAEPSMDLVARALASYVRTIGAGDSDFDRGALGEPARRGLALFRGKAGCHACHSGPLFTDEEFHNTGIAWRTGVPTDEGRARITKTPRDRGAFKTPTLREIARTAPYMHDGSLATLAQVIDYYDQGGQKNPALDTRLRPLRLSATETSPHSCARSPAASGTADNRLNARASHAARCGRIRSAISAPRAS